jgi:hypothetical protein
MEKTDEESLQELYKFRLELTNKINLINREISRLEENKVKKCDHIWENVREEYMYGEKFTICKLCGVHRGF